MVDLNGCDNFRFLVDSLLSLYWTDDFSSSIYRWMESTLISGVASARAIVTSCVEAEVTAA